MASIFYPNLLVKVAEIVPYSRNTRTHSDTQIAQIAASITQFGFTSPLLVDETNTLIAGHGRLEAAKRLHMSELPAKQAHTRNGSIRLKSRWS